MNSVKDFNAYPGLDALSTAVVILGKKRKIYYLNPSAENLFKVSRKNAVGSELNRLVEDSRDILLALDYAEQKRGSFTQHEITLENNDHSKIELSFTASPGEGHLDGHILLEFLLPTQQKKIAREEKLSIDTEWSKELVRNLAHEIKNPLGALRGAAQLLEKELNRIELKEYTAVIIKEADRLRALLDRLLTPHRLPEMVEYNIHESLEQVRSIILAEFTSDVSVIRDYDLSLPDLIGDPQQTHQALLNVARNAAQAIRGRGKIKFVTRIANKITINKKFYKLAILIQIIDNGPGIDESIREKIFFPLVSGKNDGTGIGLTISQTFIHHQNGVIDVDSEPGRTCFSITLPITSDAILRIPGHE